jgi:hypothetical protein
MFLPGFLIPSDLERMIPAGTDPFEWAELNLQASPGAVAMKDGRKFRLPTLVMAAQENGYCTKFQNRRCTIWEDSPFGCAFFGCDAGSEYLQLRMSHDGLAASYAAWLEPSSLYSRIWEHLWNSGRRAEAPEIKRARMNE